jgi:hypothetical protein
MNFELSLLSATNWREFEERVIQTHIDKEK